MEFEWDAKKATRNFVKHGIRFPSAAAVFLDPNRLEWNDLRGLREEERWLSIGLVSGKEIAVVYTLRGDTVRIISARKATQHERKDYWNREV